MTSAFALAHLARLRLEPEILDRKVGSPTDRYGRFEKLVGGDTTAYAALSVGDLLYDAYRIDPTAVEGIDFARAADLSDIFRFAHFSADLEALSPATFQGNLSQLHGYVGERIAACALRAEGADVQFPATSTEPGFDILVNGEPFQVKCLASPGGVHEHLLRYPDIPVITNSELAGFFVEDDRVTALPGFSHAEVVARTTETLDAGADLLNLQIPLISSGIAAIRVGRALWARESDPLSALGAGAADGVAGIGGGKLGAVATAGALGLLGITGGWLMVIAPVFGSIGGFRGGRFISDQLKRNFLCRIQARRLDAAICTFAREAVVVIDRMIASSIHFRDKVLTSLRDRSKFADALHRDWLHRIDREIDRRQFYRQRLSAAAGDPTTIDSSSRDLRFLAMHVMWTTAQAGVVRANLRGPCGALGVAAGEYDRSLKRWLMR
jgi:hypothetical protein